MENGGRQNHEPVGLIRFLENSGAYLISRHAMFRIASEVAEGKFHLVMMVDEEEARQSRWSPLCTGESVVAGLPMVEVYSQYSRICRRETLMVPILS